MVVRLLTGLLVAALILAGVTYKAYRQDIKLARQRVLSGGQMVETRCGPIEFAAVGEGPPVLALHGTGGGWDQGLLFARELTPGGFRTISPSRPGYLRTPMPSDATPSAEADIWACFLDALGIRKLPVVTMSAGAAPAVQLAIRHPDRITALVLITPGLYAPKPPTKKPSAFAAALTTLFLRFDFPVWFALKVAPATVYTLVAVPPSIVPKQSEAEKARLTELIRMLLPITLRREGLQNDGTNQGGLIPYPLEKVRVPTLVASAPDDLFRTLENARYTVKHIPNARLLEYPDGGHILLGHWAELWGEIREFLEAGPPGKINR